MAKWFLAVSYKRTINRIERRQIGAFLYSFIQHTLYEKAPIWCFSISNDNMGREREYEPVGFTLSRNRVNIHNLLWIFRGDALRIVFTLAKTNSLLLNFLL